MGNRRSFLQNFTGLTIGSFLFDFFPIKSWSYPTFLISDSMINNGRINTNEVDLNLFDSIKDFRIVQNFDQNNLLILAFDSSFDEKLTLPENKNITVFSYKTAIKDEIKLAGKNFYLFTNLLQSDNATIRSEGKNGSDFSELRTPLAGCNNNRIGGKGKSSDGDNVNSNNEAEDIKDEMNNGKMNGKDSGDIQLNIGVLENSIYIQSFGGVGGKGEAGSNGLVGCPNTCDENNEELKKRPLNPNGFPGLDGGNGALGGFGGKGGNLKVNFYSKESGYVGTITIGGMQGASGEAGTGGDGGAPMPNPCIIKKGGGRTSMEEKITFRVTPVFGTKGKPGIQPLSDGIRTGKPGNIEVIENSENYSKYVPAVFGKLLLAKAQSLFLQGNSKSTNEAADIFKFIIRLSSHNAGIGLKFEKDGDILADKHFFYLQNNQSDSEEWKLIENMAISYGNQISLGYDFFGNPPEYAPNLEPDYLLNKYNKVIGLIDGFEDFAIALIENQSDIQVTQTQAQLCIKQIDQHLTELNNEKINISNQIIDLNNNIQIRYSAIEIQKGKLVNLDNAFRNEIKSKSEGCDIENILLFITSVVSIGTAFASIVSAASIAGEGMGKVIKGIKASNTLENLKVALSNDGIIKDGIKDISTSMTSIKDNMSKFKEEFKKVFPSERGTAPTLKDNIPTSLINVDKDKFDQVIKEFDSAIDEALEKDPTLTIGIQYKKEFHEYVDYVLETNKHRVELTNLIASISTIQGSIQELTVQKADLQNLNVNALKNKISNNTKQAIINLYYDTKANLAKLIYLQRKAIAYQDPLSVYSFESLNDFNIKTIKADLFNQNVKLIDALNSKSYYRTFNKTPYQIKRPQFKRAFDFFSTPVIDELGDSIYILQFDIDLCTMEPALNQEECKNKIKYLKSIFFDAVNLKVMGVQAVLDSSFKKNTMINFKLRHMGNSFIPTLGNYQGGKKFKHLKKSAQLGHSLDGTTLKIKFNEEQKTNLVGTAFGNGDKCFLGVSPFASWEVRISESENPQLAKADFQNVINNLTNVNLFFWYYYEKTN